VTPERCTFASADVISFPADALTQLLLSVTVKLTVKGPDVDAGTVSVMSLPLLTEMELTLGVTLLMVNDELNPWNVDVAEWPWLSMTYTNAFFSPSVVGITISVVVAALVATAVDVAQPLAHPVEVEKEAVLQTNNWTVSGVSSVSGSSLVEFHVTLSPGSAGPSLLIAEKIGGWFTTNGDACGFPSVTPWV
jgi:hypothetical protein